ncbi:MAG: DinB family protein [Chloroflexota bacterium]
MQTVPKPTSDEHPPFMGAYVSFSPDENVIDNLTQNSEVVKAMMREHSDAFLSTPHEPGEWTIKQVLLHMMDTERIFTYRALRFARNDSTELPGFEQGDYMPYTGANDRAVEDIIAEYDTIRAASISLITSLDETTHMREGIASGHRMTVRAAIHIIVGHELFHLDSITTNYLA